MTKSCCIVPAIVALLGVTFVVTISVQAAGFVAPEELQERDQWAKARLLEGNLPFGFVFDGQPSADLLANWPKKTDAKKLDDQRTQRTFVWTDPKTGLEVRCVSVEYADFPVVEWTVYLRNTGSADTPILERIQALDVRMERSEGGEFVLRGCRGDDNSIPNGYEPYELVLGPNANKKFAAAGGRPTSVAFPYYNLTMPGGGLVFTVGWPGQWATSFARDAKNALQVTAGQELTHLCLKPGEEIRTPLMALLFWKGSDPLRAQNLWRRWMNVHNLPRPGGKPMPPILIMCTGELYPGMMSKAADEIKYAEAYVKGGAKLDYWWIDAGWYPCDGADWTKTGTWEPDPKRYPKGIKEVADFVHSKGMKLVVWFEPERVLPDTWLSNNHPEWIIGGKVGGLLNLGNPDAWKWLVNHIDKIITEQGIDLYRQDFNMDPLGRWRSADAPDRQGITENLHVQGYLAYWDELHRRHPDMPIDSCASGGRRNDLETLRRAVPLLRSDYRFEPVGTQGHTYGLSSWVPYYGTGVWDDSEYIVRSHWCPSLGIARRELGKEGLDWTKYCQMVQQWREMIPCFLGDYYPLTSYSLDKAAWIAWQFDCPESGVGVIQAFRRAENGEPAKTLRLLGLDPSAQYELTDLDAAAPKKATGKELMDRGLAIEIGAKPGAVVIKYRKL